MRIYIVIPAHNEAFTIGKTLNSLINQTFLPKKLVVVNDNSTDSTGEIVIHFTKVFEWISLVNRTSSNNHIPGSKIINAFYSGYKTLDSNYDIICKFDADLIFPNDYLEKVVKQFSLNRNIGVCGGIPCIEINGKWTFEKIASKNHVRGPLKAYRKSCFKRIGGLKKSIGWDTVDILLAQYFGWKTETIKDLRVKHLKPTGINYSKSTMHLQGVAFYKMRYGLILGILASLKSAWHQKKINQFFYSIYGYINAYFKKTPFIVSREEGKFIRRLRWKGISKFFLGQSRFV